MDIELFKKVSSAKVSPQSSIAKSILESKIQLLSIEKKDEKGNTIVFDIVPWKNQEGLAQGNPFLQLNYSESMTSTFMNGTLFLNDHLNWGDEFVLNGTEKIILGCTESVAAGDFNEQETKDTSVCVILEFSIYS